MTLVLGYWLRQWQSVALDSQTGVGHIRWLSRRPRRCAGWAVKHKGVWYGVWSDGEKIIFQAAGLRIPMTGTYRASNVRVDASRTFMIAENGRKFFELTYKALDRDWDPTFDLGDLEQEDFFVYAARLWSDEKWQLDASRNWAREPSGAG